MNWDLLDFAVFGMLLLIIGSLIYIANKKFKKSKYRVVLIIGIVIFFLLIWAELGVGIFGTPLAGN